VLTRKLQLSPVGGIFQAHIKEKCGVIFEQQTSFDFALTYAAHSAKIPHISPQVHTNNVVLYCNAVISSEGNTCTRSMWLPVKDKFGFHERERRMPLGMYFGLQDIPSIAASNVKVKYQDGRVFLALDWELTMYANFSAFTRGSETNVYTNAIYEERVSGMLLSHRTQICIRKAVHSRLIVLYFVPLH
jgi:hypothetical protein